MNYHFTPLKGKSKITNFLLQKFPTFSKFFPHFVPNHSLPIFSPPKKSLPTPRFTFRLTELMGCIRKMRQLGDGAGTKGSKGHSAMSAITAPKTLMK